jgi:hypothetical protein
MRFHALALVAAALSAQPVRTAWIRAASSAPVSIRPDVHSVEESPSEIIVRSAGLSLARLGPLAVNPNPPAAPRQYTFRIPRNPQPASAARPRVPADYGGVFLNGVPIFNQLQSASYLGQNLWHFDLTARNAAATHAPTPPGLLEALLPASGPHSPLIGFALDGYPVYGPWNNGTRMRSSYQLRNISTRDRWPDGTRLAPGQAGPPVGPEFPLGAFAEDYQFVPGSGDLDAFNGRYTVTPEYPNGTYAYFLSTDSQGRLAFPYLLAHEFHGQLPGARPLKNPAISGGLAFEYDPAGLLRFQLTTPVPHLEFVHQMPMHVLVISHDLAHFAHIHPEADPHGIWQVAHRFPGGGRYRVYVDYTPPGANQRLEHFDLAIPGPPPPAQRPHALPAIALDNARSLRAGADLELLFRPLQPIAQWRPYLGAWAHVIIAGDGLSSFLHAHPIDSLPQSQQHSHSAQDLGPPPDRLRVAALFPAPGRYKLWLQIQTASGVETIPFQLQVAPAAPAASPNPAVPPGAITVDVGAHGFQPARIEIPASRSVTLALRRSAEPNCGATFVIPSLGISRQLPPASTVILQLPPQPPGELRFTCGMGMYRGSIIAASH